MARYRGPRLKKARALGCALPGLTRKSTDRRPYPPGDHGQSRGKAKKSVYGTQLLEKQKLRYNYGVQEKYLKNLVRRAFRSRENPGEKLVKLLESRLDNVVFRAGFAPTIVAARQLVGHGHIRVNGKKVNIPSCQVRVGDDISVPEKVSKFSVVEATWAQPSLVRPSWLSCDEGKMAAKMISEPQKDEIGFVVELSSVVELYSRSVSK